MSDQLKPTQAEVSADLLADLARLGTRVHCVPEVWMLCWTHSIREAADRLRIDYVAELEGRLIGIEVKAAPQQQVELGRDLLQCAQYAHGVVGANRTEVPQAWVGRPLEAVFLRTTLVGTHQGLRNHALCAHRLYGPANVGFVVKEKRGLCLRLSGERFWTEWSGYHQGMLTKNHQSGNGTFQAVIP